MGDEQAETYLGRLAIWKGFARLSPLPPPDARWLDLTGGSPRPQPRSSS